MTLKLAKLASGGIGIVKDGRIEPMDSSTDQEVIRRVVDCVAALEGFSDPTVALFARGGTKAGNLVERTVAWSLFYSHNNRMALKILEKARAEIAKTVDPI